MTRERAAAEVDSKLHAAKYLQPSLTQPRANKVLSHNALLAPGKEFRWRLAPPLVELSRETQLR